MDGGVRWRRSGAGVLVVHGIAHVVGATDAIRAITDDGAVPYVFGRWDLTDTSILRAAAMVWAIAAAGFVVVGIGTWVDARWWRPALVATAAVSAVLCVVALPQTVIGLIVNAAILGGASRATATCEEESG